MEGKTTEMRRRRRGEKTTEMRRRRESNENLYKCAKF